MPTHIPNWFSIKEGMLHNNALGESEEDDLKAATPDDVKEEQWGPLEPQVRPEDNEEGDRPYVTYTYVCAFEDSNNDMIYLTNSHRETTEDKTSQYRMEPRMGSRILTSTANKLGLAKS